MPWDESIPVESWADFKAFAYGHACPAPPAGKPFPKVLYLFRGQGEAACPLDPSLTRAALKTLFPNQSTKPTSEQRLDAANDVLLQKRVIELEKSAFRQFSRCASQRRDLPIHPRPNDVVGWLTIMQQFQCHTRLLDWTLSPYVAAYMAVQEMSNKWKCDGAVWAFDYAAVRKAMENRYGAADLPRKETGEQMSALWEPKGPPIDPKLHAFRLEAPIERLVNQDAWFSLSPNIMAEHSDLMERLLGNETSKRCFKLTIPRTQKGTFLEELEMMGITEASLFPDLDGLGRDVKQMLERQFAKLPEPDGAASGENGA